MPTIYLAGRPLDYSDQRPKGKPQTFLLIHGAGGSRRVWPDWLRTWPDARVLAIDLPGHGGSPPPGRRAVAHYAAVIEQFATELRLENVVLIGHSLGAAVALTVAARSILRPAGLILLGASGRMPVSREILAAASTSPEKVATFIVDKGGVDASQEERDRLWQLIHDCGGMTLYGDLLASDRYDLRPHLTAIDAPTLIIAGEQDRLTPLRFSESLAAAMPQARLAVLEGAGHFTMIERPDAVAALVRDFTEELGRRQTD